MNKFTLKKSLFTFLWIFISLLFSCKNAVEPVQIVNTNTPDVAIKWANMSLYVMSHTPSNTPTYGSRSLAYMGITMYETVVNGSPTDESLAWQLSDLTALPQPEQGKTYNWIVSLNAGQAFMLKKLFEHASSTVMAQIDSLALAIHKTESSIDNQEVILRSKQYGEAVANALFEWSKTDGGYQGYLRNFPPYVFPTTPGSWTPPIRGQSPSRLPLHPYWGENRRFVKANTQLFVPAIIPYSESPTSQYYAQFLDVYSKNNILTPEEKEIATWWGDDPSETAGPPGHSYNLATIAIKAFKPDIFKAAQTYARTGISVADAFIACWKCKYTYFAQRPASFVNAHIDPTWVQFWPEPPFPAFSSGHSTQAAAAAIVLTELYGNSFKFIDNTHEGRPKNTLRNVEYKNRSFTSFWEAAEESAYSRLLGGIHTRQDNETGLIEGRKIGRNVNELKWHK